MGEVPWKKQAPLLKETLLHWAIEFLPTMVYLALLASGLLRLEMHPKTLFFLLLWSRYAIQILNLFGLIEPLFGLELVVGIERGLVIGQEIPPMVTSILKIGRPDNLQAYTDMLRKHFMKYKRLRSQWVSVRYSHFFKEVTDK